jgi:UDP-N-acetyl-D-galactosamine dehydrogenase
MNLYEKLLKKETKLSVIGLGYVGLPIALEFAKKISVIGFDIKSNRVEMMKKGEDPSKELDKKHFEGCDIHFTCNIEDLKQASFHIIAVPTPIDKHNMPDLRPVISASETIGKIIKPGDVIVFESTVYPGCTEEDCIPVIEKFSGLKFQKEFNVGYSPERINPGDKEHSLSTVVKIVSGNNEETLETVANVYELVVKAGVYRASSIKVAEAAKIIENTQRDVNIALMNELSIIFNRMNINTFEVLEAAGTKWNFLKFSPGLVGGHCIGVDPYYLTYKAKEYRYHAQIINSGRFVNDTMGFYVAKQTVKKIISANKNVLSSRVLVMGVTFKEDVSDLRNSRVADLINEFKSYGITKLDITDPFANSHELKEEYGFELVPEPNGKYDAVIIAVSHKPYKELPYEYFESLLNERGILVDVKGIFRKQKHNVIYWSL